MNFLLTTRPKNSKKNVIIENGDIKLAGILTLPVKDGNYPVVIHIHGSGPNDRDETVG
ncbi:MAG: hypothetical protein IPJ66_18040 [Bacteroidetes bacterium]|nr:hypothetical protein [Bacteroidota bacterium]